MRRWTQTELEWINVFAYCIWHKSLTYYKAVQMLDNVLGSQSLIPRTIEAIRKQLKERVRALEASE